ncbi:MAG: LPS export ABC transporter ATP-binding protein [Planctomycetota bacterium]|nr:MAG: LPS export ABC transporter ATP-binding protein [Planctomycetota bacterium]
MLDVQGLSKRFGRRQVVSGVAMQVEPGEIVGLLGANGAGKTTTFRMMVGLLRQDTGRITLAGEDISRMPMYQRARHGIGYLAQEPTIFAHLSVADNIRIVLEHCEPDRRRRQQRLSQLLEELNLADIAENIAGRCSGGERRRLEITRAMVIAPKVLFFDEPFAGVDPKSRDDIRAIANDFKARGVSVLITDHHAEAILQMVDRLYVMESGSILASGTPDEIMANQDVRRAYLGESFQLPGQPISGMSSS